MHIAATVPASHFTKVTSAHAAFETAFPDMAKAALAADRRFDTMIETYFAAFRTV